jgi:hypothetical protein
MINVKITKKNLSNNSSKTIEDLIENSKLKEAFEMMKVHFKKIKDDENYKITLHQLQRFTTNEKDKNMNTISNDDYSRERNKINIAALELLTNIL